MGRKTQRNIPKKAPMRKIVGLNNNEYKYQKAELECGHSRLVTYGQKKTRCVRCLRRTKEKLNSIYKIINCRIQPKIKLSVIKDIQNAFNRLEMLEEIIVDVIDQGIRKIPIDQIDRGNQSRRQFHSKRKLVL